MDGSPRAVILAAGQGKRMRSSVPKVLHRIAGRSLLLHVVDTALQATGRRPIVVINPAHPQVREALGDAADIVVQAQPRGTADALRSIPPDQRSPGPVIVLSADVPLIRAETVRHLLDRHLSTGALCTLLSVRPHDATGLGRVVRGATGTVERIVEEADLDPEQPVRDECNAGVYVFTGPALWPALERVTAENAQAEHYLTDVVAMLGGGVEAVLVPDPEEALGINDRRQLAEAARVMRRRLLDDLMLSGVTIEDPGTTYVDAGVSLGPDSVVRPMTILAGATSLGRQCSIGPMAQLRDVRGGDRVAIGASVLERCELGDDVSIGHFNRVRPDSVLDSGVSLGTHAEVKNSRVGSGTQIGHFSCILDSDVGRGVNIGAGTVTCNYDGADKHRTTIDDEVFVGSDSILVAPLHIGAGAYIAAGSVITDEVSAGALAIERTRQRTIEGWTSKRRPRGATTAR